MQGCMPNVPDLCTEFFLDHFCQADYQFYFIYCSVTTLHRIPHSWSICNKPYPTYYFNIAKQSGLYFLLEGFPLCVGKKVVTPWHAEDLLVVSSHEEKAVFVTLDTCKRQQLQNVCYDECLSARQGLVVGQLTQSQKSHLQRPPWPPLG